MIDKDFLLAELRKLNTGSDIEYNHVEADDLLLEYIGDGDIEEAYRKITRYYA